VVFKGEILKGEQPPIIGRTVSELLTGEAKDADQISKRERCSVRKVNMTISLAFWHPNLSGQRFWENCPGERTPLDCLTRRSNGRRTGRFSLTCNYLPRVSPSADGTIGHAPAATPDAWWVSVLSDPAAEAKPLDYFATLDPGLALTNSDFVVL
jgi:hypothetical protein